MSDVAGEVAQLQAAWDGHCHRVGLPPSVCGLVVVEADTRGFYLDLERLYREENGERALHDAHPSQIRPRLGAHYTEAFRNIRGFFYEFFFQRLQTLAVRMDVIGPRGKE